MGFHQIELEEGFRDITTFSADDSLFRYTRLMSFGISSAPEQFKNMIRVTTPDIQNPPTSRTPALHHTLGHEMLSLKLSKDTSKRSKAENKGKKGLIAQLNDKDVF